MSGISCTYCKEKLPEHTCTDVVGLLMEALREMGAIGTSHGPGSDERAAALVSRALEAYKREVKSCSCC